MKILFVDQSSNLYGSERGLLVLLKNLKLINLEAVVVCSNKSLLWNELKRLGFKLENMEFGGYSWLKRPDWQLKFLLNFMKLIQRHRPDAVVINFEGNVPLMVLGSRLMGCPVIRMLKREVRSDDSSEPGYRMHHSDRLSFLASSGVICISGAVEKQLRHALNVGLEFPAVTLFDPQELVSLTDEEIQIRRKSLGLKADTLVVGEFARIHPVKGIDTLIRAAPLVLEKLPNVQFLVVGDVDGSALSMEYRKELDKLIRDLGVANQFIWTGFVPDPLVVMATCNVTTLPTRAEGLGRVLIESWAVGRPVVASYTDGPGEVISLSGGGLLHPVDDHVDLAHQLIQLLANPTRCAELATLGREWVGHNCNSENYRSQFLACVGKFIKRKN